MDNKKIRVAVLGVRGFPKIVGGVETHAENLFPLLVKRGCCIEVISRSPYELKDCNKEWNGVFFRPLWSPKSKSLEAVVHTFFGILYAAFISRPDILHIQAIGPALLTPLARFLGLRVVVTHHGPDYDRQKWGRLAKFALRLGEFFGMRYSNARIVISDVIRRLVNSKHGLSSHLIPNGVILPVLQKSILAVDSFNLTPGRYVLFVSRLVPEKRHLDLIAAFNLANIENWKLAIVGSSTHPDSYSRQVLDAVSNSPNIICTGFQSGLPLQELYSHAGLFVLPSSHEGLPIAMLEALSFGLPVIASDIPANVEVGLPEDNYFPLGDINVLAEKIRSFSSKNIFISDRDNQRKWVTDTYDWEQIATQTCDVYRSVIGR